MSNLAFRRALRSLAHPITLGAVVLLIANDHLLRRLWPSWWTGKLGDAAWLVFAPLMLAVLIAWLVPARLKRQEALVAALAFGLVGAGFALAKTVPAMHQAATATLAALTGAPSALRLDPTDLLTLPALGIGWWVWQRSAAPRPEQQAMRQPVAWPVLVLGALATIANSPAPNYGLDCVLPQPDGTVIVAASGSWRDEQYASQDGGLTWRSLPPGSAPLDGCDYLYDTSWQLPNPNNPQVVYQFTRGVSIERSLDGGQAWQTEVSFAGIEARMVYYTTTRSTLASFDAIPGPLDAAIHPATGSVIAAMGHEGVLVRTPDGQWQAVAVGDYYPEEIRRFGQVWGILGGELFLALVLVFLAFGTLALITPWRKLWLLALVIPGWIGWLVAAIMSPAPNAGSYLTAPIVLATLGTGLFALAAAVAGGVLVRRAPLRGFAFMSAASIDPALFYLLPFALWAIGSIPRYGTALWFALALIVATLVAGGLIVRHVLRDVSPGGDMEDIAAALPTDH